MHIAYDVGISYETFKYSHSLDDCIVFICDFLECNIKRNGHHIESNRTEQLTRMRASYCSLINVSVLSPSVRPEREEKNK